MLKVHIQPTNQTVLTTDTSMLVITLSKLQVSRNGQHIVLT